MLEVKLLTTQQSQTPPQTGDMFPISAHAHLVYTVLPVEGSDQGAGRHEDWTIRKSYLILFDTFQILSCLTSLKKHNMSIKGSLYQND